jgi:hypothetical protein
MIHADDQHGVSSTALDEFCALHQRDETRDAGVGNVLHRAVRPEFGGQIGGEQVGLQMTAGGSRAGAAIGQAFERFDVGFGGRENEAEAVGGDSQGRARHSVRTGVARPKIGAHGVTRPEIVVGSNRFAERDGRELMRWVIRGLNRGRADEVGLESRAAEAVVGAEVAGVVLQGGEQGGGAVARSTDDAATRDGNAWLTHTTITLRWR